MFSYIFNSLSFFLWIGLDSIDYYLSFLIWILTLTTSFLFNLIYSYFFFNNFSSKKNDFSSSKPMLDKNLLQSLNKSTKSFYVSKHDLNWILYSWLTNSHSVNETSEEVLEKLFNANLTNKNWKTNYDFFIKLYRLSFLLKLTDDKNNFFNLNLSLNAFKNNSFKGEYYNIIYYLNNTNSLTTHFSLITHFIIKNYKNYFDTTNTINPSLRYLNIKNEWNMNNFNNELNKFPFLLKFKNGFFFLHDFNYQNLSNFIFNFNELWLLNNSFKNQLISSKWNRWLYRYSILHRKILKNSHKLTLSKKLINSGFYDSKIFNKNIWANEHLSKMESNDTFSSIFNSHYLNIFNKQYSNFNNHNLIINNNGSQNNSLNLLNFYENSYFWYIKRFYNFNTSLTNNIKSKLINNQNFIFNSKLLNKDLNSLNIKYYTLLNYFLNSSKVNLSFFSHNNNNFFSYEDLFKINQTSNINNYYNAKDLFLITQENDLLNKDNLNILYWITSSNLNKNGLNYFNPILSNNSALINKSNTNFILNSNNSNSNDNNFWYTYSLINLDKFFFKDALYLSLFIN